MCENHQCSLFCYQGRKYIKSIVTEYTVLYVLLLISGMLFHSTLSRKKHKGQNVYLTLMAPGSVFPSPCWGWYTRDAETIVNICHIHSRFPIRKYARYGTTSYSRPKQTLPVFWKSSSTPKNTLIFKDSITIDHFRAKTVKTRYVRAST